MSTSYFEIKHAAGGQFCFNLKAPNHQVILTGETYATKQGCHNGITSVKENAPFDNRYERKDNPGNYRFNLKAENGRVIGSSEGYTTAYNRDQGIADVKRYAPVATIVDLT